MAYLKIAYLSGVASADTKLGLKQATIMGSAPEAPQTSEAPVSAPGTNVRPVAPPAPAPMPGALDGSGEPKVASAAQYAGSALKGGLAGGTVGAIAAPEGQRLEGAALGASLGAGGATLGRASATKGLDKHRVLVEKLKNPLSAPEIRQEFIEAGSPKFMMNRLDDTEMWGLADSAISMGSDPKVMDHAKALTAGTHGALGTGIGGIAAANLPKEEGGGEPKLASAKDTALKYVGAGTGGGLWGGGVGALAAGEGNRLEGAGVGAGIGALGGVGGMNFARRTNNRALKEIAQDLGTMEAAGINKVVDIPAGMKFKSVNPNYEMPQASILEGTEALMAQMSDPAYQAAAEVGGTSIGQLAGMGGALSGGLALRAGEKNN